jgi:3-oxoacyl-[acyl-carrier-protein] synthase III
MGVRITSMNSVYNREDGYDGTVTDLAIRALKPMLHERAPTMLQLLVVATTCPDTLAPTLGQRIVQYFHPYFQHCQVIDLVQGCAGGLSALVLASQLTEASGKNAAVVLADAARQAVSSDNDARQFFSNGAFACLLESESSNCRLLHHKSQQFEDLTDLVQIKLGHAAHREILIHKETILANPICHLGLTMNPAMAMRLVRRAEQFYITFQEEYPHDAEVMIFHQVNPSILGILEITFSKYTALFVNRANEIGNCGAASYAVALNEVKHRLPGKKVLLCSFGTGGVISAGLWQF